MEEFTTFVGLDVHKDTIVAALLRPGSSEPLERQVEHTPSGVSRLVTWLRRHGEGPVWCCYEAGPTGFELQRRLIAAGLACQVVAPALIPRKPGERVKTDRRDALKLARYLRAGELTEVCPPTPAEEAVRALCRCREDAVDDRRRARQRLLFFLLQRGLRCSSKPWTQSFNRWLRQLTFEHPADGAAFRQYLMAVEVADLALRSVEQQLAECAAQEPYREPVGWLRCFRGIDTVTAMILVSELYAFARFTNPRALMAYLGLTPGERSSGQREQRLGITKTGNRRVRRVLVEAAWHYRHAPAEGVTLRRRRQGQPAWVIAAADKAMVRLNHKQWRLLRAGKHLNKAVIATARELAGFLWAVLRPGAGEQAPLAA